VIRTPYPLPDSIMKKSILFLNCFLVASLSYGQSTFEDVAVIFDTYCNVSCHNGPGPGAALNLETSDMAALYANLVGAIPGNPAAAGKGLKVVDPGHPHNSFILKKLGFAEWDEDYDLEIEEGFSMPDGEPHLSKENVELVRQWIIQGAPQNGNVVDADIIDAYYNDNGMARIERPAAPDSADGFQVHLGPFFLDPGEEAEYYKKHRLYNEDEKKVSKMVDYINDESHHLLLFEFTNGSQSQEVDGLRPVTVQNAFQDAEYVVGWVDTDSILLPEGTAYYFQENTVLDLNLHLRNYAFNGDSVLPAEAYINFYYADESEVLQQMYSDLLIYSPFSLIIPNDGNEHTFSETINDPSSTDTMNVWMLSTHTHKYGTDFDLYKAEPGGGQGEQLYEGFFNTDYIFNQGAYDWQHPAKRYFEPLEPIELKYGIIQEAKYQVNDPDETANIIFFGLTTDDEMMLTFIQYTLQSEIPDHTGITNQQAESEELLMAYPNPFTDEVNIVFNVKDVVEMRLEVFNTLGQSVEVLFDGTNIPGGGMTTFKPVGNLDPSGIYMVRMTTPDQVFSTRIIKAK
jgi:hypothetical protein